MFDQLIAKNAKTAAATVKSAAAKKTAGKTVSPAKTLAPVKTEIKFAIQDFARPRAGAALAAHTAAFLGMSGMADGKAIPKQQAAKIVGARAVQYHTDNGNFEHTANGLVLTEKGLMFFLTRTVDPELLAAYESVLSTGKLNEMANVKNEASRIAL